ncbi:MAG: TIGR00730 family Rossman fold protein [Muribaculum sp.]|nr:TIGR00730 family Rossman fold protein [Muribaculum sp.]
MIEEIAGVPKGVVVYGASRGSIDRLYLDAAYQVGRLLAEKGIPVISGGGSRGVMQYVTEGALDEKGIAIGVLPEFMLERGWNHPALTHTLSASTMHERKATMAALSRAAIAMPGGVGTLDELFELITWRQLSLYKGNIVICNVGGFYDRLLDHLAYTASKDFMRSEGPSRLWMVASDAVEAVDMALNGQLGEITF